MRVLGVDPGTVICGYAVLEARGRHVEAVAYGVIRAKTKDTPTLPDRLLRVFQGLGQVIDTYHPEVLAIEEAYVGPNPRSALAIGEGRAAAIVAARQRGLPVHSYQASVVKRAVTGSGRAKKVQVQRMVTTLLGLPAPPSPTDAADALAVAFTHLHRRTLPSA